jgi:hypothetical protein
MQRLPDRDDDWMEFFESKIYEENQHDDSTNGLKGAEFKLEKKLGVTTVPSRHKNPLFSRRK